MRFLHIKLGMLFHLCGVEGRATEKRLLSSES